MRNSTFDPKNIREFDKSKVKSNAQGITANPTLGGTTNMDLYFDDDHLLTGFYLVGDGLTLGDYIHLQAIDTDNIFGLGANTVINQFVTNMYLPTSIDEQFDVVYPAKVYGGLSLRVVFNSTGTTGTPFFAVNFKVHKVLI